MGIGAVYKLLAGFWQHESAWLVSMKLGIGCRTRGRRQPILVPGQKRGGTAPRGTSPDDTVPARKLTWLTWRQHRQHLLAGLTLLAALGTAYAVLRVSLVTYVRDSGLSACLARPDEG